MNDNEKELHRLAALGAGYEINQGEAGYSSLKNTRPETLWSPANNPADSFRLARDCNLMVDFGNGMVTWPLEVTGKDTDPLRATMEAIFLAAVEIGKAREKRGF